MCAQPWGRIFKYLVHDAVCIGKELPIVESTLNMEAPRTHHRNVGSHFAIYVTSYPRWLESSWKQLWLTAVCFPVLTRPGHEADHSVPRSVRVKNAWSFACTPFVWRRDMVLSAGASSSHGPTCSSQVNDLLLQSEPATAYESKGVTWMQTLSLLHKIHCSHYTVLLFYHVCNVQHRFGLQVTSYRIMNRFQLEFAFRR